VQSVLLLTSQHCRTFTLSRKECIVCTFVLEYGTYEILLFLWLRYALARLVFQCPDAQAVTFTNLCSPSVIEINAFQNRMTASNVVPDGILTDDTTLREFRSRANVQELGLWTESHNFVVPELA